jgi:hypothetical protein
LPGSIERSAATIFGCETAIPASTISRPSGPARTPMLPPDPSSMLTWPRSGCTVMGLAAAAALMSE